MSKTHIILDTDIGGDIDDTWALAFLLASAEVSLDFIITWPRCAEYRARIVAKMLEIAGQDHIPIGLGDAPTPKPSGNYNPIMAYKQAAWLKDYRLDDYKGEIRKDGCAALIEYIMDAKEPVKLLCIGPLDNIAKALELKPEIAGKCDFVGLHGSVRLGYFGEPNPTGEYNVVASPKAAQAVFAAPWRSMTITPLDTCGFIYLDGPDYQKIRLGATPLAQAVSENYRFWNHPDAANWRQRSSLICDVVGAYLAFDDAFLNLEELPITVTDTGHTVIDPTDGKLIKVATSWKDFETFKHMVATRIAAN